LRRRAVHEMDEEPYPPVAEYALISDCHSAALVSTTGSIDWCCMPRMDAASCFGRLLDWNRGGSCWIRPTGGYTSARRYLDGTMVLETTYRTPGGEARLLDLLTMHEGGRDDPYRQVLRVVEGIRGSVDVEIRAEPRFDYGDVRPWLLQLGVQRYGAIGGNHGLLISSDVPIEATDDGAIRAQVSVRPGHRAHLSIEYVRPERLDGRRFDVLDPSETQRRLAQTIAWWRKWASRARVGGPHAASVVRSALVLKALTNAPTGAIAAAATTSLPEAPGGARNWDYRHSWIRDSAFTVRSLAEVGFEAEADGFRRFVERSAAARAAALQILYGLGGERRLREFELDELEGYRGARPVRVGNAAARQRQLDVYGHLSLLTYRWHRRGRSPDDDYYRFLVDLIDDASHLWREPDRGIWEMRGPPRHFVHSKAMCWTALDVGIRLAEECERRAPVRAWTKARDACHRAIMRDGYDRKRGIFVQAFDSHALDAALLLLPNSGLIAFDDPRMVRTTDAIREELSDEGLIRRYSGDDGLEGTEGAFIACSFWLAECLARQGRLNEARDAFDRAIATGNDVGLFSEESDPKSGDMLGNFPQALTHMSHIAAALVLHGENGAAATPIGPAA
jgi:GH15 family glucan-1,4-alpha-glucosidase